MGLAYTVMLPIGGAAAAAWMGIKALNATYPATMKVVTFAAAPFIGLAFILVLPFAGVAMLAWMATRALTEKAHVE